MYCDVQALIILICLFLLGLFMVFPHNIEKFSARMCEIDTEFNCYNIDFYSEKDFNLMCDMVGTKRIRGIKECVIKKEK